MCKAADQTAVAVLKGIEPTFVELLTLEGLASTTDGIAAVTAYNAAVTALSAWVPGTTAENVVQLLNDFVTVFDTLPIPTEVKSLSSLIVGGITAVVGIITANSPAPASPAGTPATEESQALHAMSVRTETEAKVKTLVPSFKMSKFHSPAVQYRNAWNKQVDEVAAVVDEKYLVLKQ